jgi:hypothetical protein
MTRPVWRRPLSLHSRPFQTAACLTVSLQFDLGDAGAAAKLRRVGECAYMRMPLEGFLDKASERAGAVPVHDAHVRQSGEHGTVEKPRQLLTRVLLREAEELELRSGVLAPGHDDARVRARSRCFNQLARRTLHPEALAGNEDLDTVAHDAAHHAG